MEKNIKSQRLNKKPNFLSPDLIFPHCRCFIYLICFICQINCDMTNFCIPSSSHYISYQFKFRLHWLITFSHCIPGSVNLLYLLISSPRCTLIRCQPWMKIYCWRIWRRIFPADQPGVTGKGKRNHIDFLPSLDMPVECFPRRADLTSLSVIIYYLTIRANSVHLDMPDLVNWSTMRSSLSGFLGSFETPLQDVTWGHSKVIPFDNVLILVRLIDDSIAETPRASSRIRLDECWICYNRSILTSAGRKRNLCFPQGVDPVQAAAGIKNHPWPAQQQQKKSS